MPTKKRLRSEASGGAAQSPISAYQIAPIILFFCVVAFYWTPLTAQSASIQWDAADMHYPLQKYFADRALEGELPFWTPYLFGGFPLLANPEVAAWYVPHWPFYLAGVTPGAIQVELALHALLACAGTYLLLLKHTMRPAAAIIGAFAYGLSGFFAGHSSHVGMFSAAAWLPWILLAYRQAVDTRYPLRFAALGALAGGMMILAGYFQTAMYGFLGLGLYALSDLWGQRSRAVTVVSVVAGMLAGAIAVGAFKSSQGWN
jgi:hypothetical protein